MWIETVGRIASSSRSDGRKKLPTIWMSWSPPKTWSRRPSFQTTQNGSTLFKMAMFMHLLPFCSPNYTIWQHSNLTTLLFGSWDSRGWCWDMPCSLYQKAYYRNLNLWPLWTTGAMFPCLRGMIPYSPEVLLRAILRASPNNSWLGFIYLPSNHCQFGYELFKMLSSLFTQLVISVTYIYLFSHEQLFRRRMF